MPKFPIRFFPDRITSFDFVRFIKPALLASLFVVLGSIGLCMTHGLNRSIDFTGGVLIELKAENMPPIKEMREALAGAKIGGVSLQSLAGDEIMIKVGVEKDSAAIVTQIKNSLASSFPLTKWNYQRIDFVGPEVSKDLIYNAVLSILVGFVLIMGYIWIRFDWQYGLGVILALIHDAVATLGFFSLTGLEFNLTSIAAILTIIGYSVNDSVVIYDRIRSNVISKKGINLKLVINASINETLSRTLLTIVSVLIALISLFVYGGSTLHSFSIAIFFGILIGTYSSIYISAPILIYLIRRKNV